MTIAELFLREPAGPIGLQIVALCTGVAGLRAEDMLRIWRKLPLWTRLWCLIADADVQRRLATPPGPSSEEGSK